MEMTTKLKKLPLYPRRKMKCQVNMHLRHSLQFGIYITGNYILPFLINDLASVKISKM